MMRIGRWLTVAAVAVLGAWGSLTHAATPKAPLTILISLDGFRPDYLERGRTPTLNALAAEGARGAMRPSFPSLTYPNHYTLVTGKRPDHHGIVSNTLDDDDIPGVSFSASNQEAVGDGRWWNQAKPIWVDAERQGVHVGTLFWPGSEAAIDGVRPSRWRVYDAKVPYEERVDTVLGWIDARNPPLGLATLYFDRVDSQGHHHGPYSPEVDAALAEADAAIARMVAGLKARGLYDSTNIVVVADHGMAPQPLNRLVDLSALVDPAKAKFISTGAMISLRPLPGFEAEVKAAMLKVHPHLTCWEKSKVPARFGYGSNRRVPPIVCLADSGWSFMTASAIEKRLREHPRDGGAHGYDPADPDMRAVFVARGPAFRRGVVLPPFGNVDVYLLLTRLIGVRGQKGDGGLAAVKAALR